MPIRLTCPNCNDLVQAPDAAAGKRGKCPGCGSIIDIPLGHTPSARLAGAVQPQAPSSATPPSSLPVEMKANRTIAGKTCPICQFEITLGEDVRNCEHCNLSYHLVCWNQNGGCKTLDCPLAPSGYEIEPPAQAVAAPETAASDMKVCPMCGEMIKSVAVKCRFCGEYIEPVAGGVMTGGRTSYPKAPLGKRFVASLIDSLIVAPGYVLLQIGQIVAEGDQEAGGGIVLVGLVLLIPGLLYSFLKDGFKGGQSWGKRAMGLMVVKLDTNEACSYGKSALRALVLNVMGCVCGLVEPIIVLAKDDGRRLGDMAANTQVIDVNDYRGR